MRINNRFLKIIFINFMISVWINSIIYVIKTFELNGEESNFKNFGNEATTIFTRGISNKHVTFHHSEKRKAVLLMASYRSGSSLTGELFNQHDRILYFFGNLA